MAETLDALIAYLSNRSSEQPSGRPGEMPEVQYGGGALLVRDIARRLGGRWPTIALLALAYALVEEGFTTQTLFNPTYAGQRLLDYGYIPAIGTSLHWTVFVLTLHVVWSIGSGKCAPLWRRGQLALWLTWLSDHLEYARRASSRRRTARDDRF